MKKSNKIFTFISAGILLIALIILIIGYYLSGVNLLEFLISKWAMYVYTGLVVWVVIAIIYIVKEKVKKL